MIRTCLTLVILVCSLACASLIAGAREQVVMVTLDGLTLDELVRGGSPAFHALSASGAIGLLNTRTTGRPTFADAAVTIGAGVRAKGDVYPLQDDKQLPRETPRYTRLGFNIDEIVWGEPAAVLFSRNTGVHLPTNGIVHLAIAPLRTLNAIPYAAATPGLLGQHLQADGVAVAVYGNADTGQVPSREAVAIVMNRDGWVPTGDVGPRTLVPDRARPFGQRTSYDYLRRCLLTSPAPRSFTVIELGDFARLEAARAFLTPERYATLKRQTLRECGAFLAQVDADLRRTTDRYLLCLVVLAPSSEAVLRGDMLTPMLLTGSEIPPGLLTSPATRRRGLVTLLDLAPTVLAFLHTAPPRTMQGSPIGVARGSATFAALVPGNARMDATFLTRPPVLLGYIVVVIFGVLLSLTLILRGASRGGVLVETQRTLMLALLLAPLALLVAPGLHIYATLPTAAFLALFSLAGAMLVSSLSHDLRFAFAMIGLATTTVICADLLAGTPLMRQSILSYDPIIGARFYGIGNEYTGVLLGATLLGLYALLDYCPALHARHLLLLIPVYLAVFFLIGAPGYGTEFGGMLAAIAGFVLALARIRQRHSWGKTLLGAGIVGVVLLGALILMNVLLPTAQQTHIGRAFTEAAHNGPGVLIEFAMRKWAMNLRLMRLSTWTYALVSLIISLIVLLFRPVGVVRHLLGKYPWINAGLAGILLGTVIGLLTNDSGIVMAATSLLFLAVPLILLVQQELQASHTPTTPPAPLP